MTTPWVFVVACVKGKATTRTRARDLYISDWFGKARAFVEATGKPWYILSAKHGLVDPDERHDPYDCTLYQMSAAQRRAWGRKVGDELAAVLPPHARVVVLAGNIYRKPIEDRLDQLAARVYVPMLGLKIGEQLRWLKHAIRQLGRGVALHRVLGAGSEWFLRPDGTLDDAAVAAAYAKRP